MVAPSGGSQGKEGVLAPVPAARRRAGEPQQGASPAAGSAPRGLQVSDPARASGPRAPRILAASESAGSRERECS